MRERDIARQKTITAERTTEFVKGLFQVSDPSEAKGEEISARQVLDRGMQQIEGSLGAEPDVKAELVSTLGEVYIGLGSFRRADELIRRSLSIPVRNPETRARQLVVLAGSMVLQGEYERAIAAYDQALARPASAGAAARSQPLFAGAGRAGRGAGVGGPLRRGEAGAGAGAALGRRSARGGRARRSPATSRRQG